MPNTRDIRNRIRGVKNTQKITRAMQLVASSKMKKAQDRALEGRPYAQLLARMLALLTGKVDVEDFSHPFLTSGLGIAVPLGGGGGWAGALTRLISPRFLGVVIGLLGLLLLVGVLTWLFERRRNPQFGGDPVKGIGSGLFELTL